ncbi:MAG: hypothetical protein O6938_04375, partial [Gammaproteobacteria bacterium]|nr:hypothetical protein [Gammaproteobacteria bacterium]
KEPLINSVSFRCEAKIPIRRTVQIKASIAAKTQSNRFAHGASFSQTIGNDELDGPALRYFSEQMLIHELLRGSLELRMRYYAAFVGWLRYILFEAGLNDYYLHKLTG